MHGDGARQAPRAQRRVPILVKVQKRNVEGSRHCIPLTAGTTNHSLPPPHTHTPGPTQPFLSPPPDIPQLGQCQLALDRPPLPRPLRALRVLQAHHAPVALLSPRLLHHHPHQRDLGRARHPRLHAQVREGTDGRVRGWEGGQELNWGSGGDDEYCQVSRTGTDGCMSRS